MMLLISNLLFVQDDWRIWICRAFRVLGSSIVVNSSTMHYVIAGSAHCHGRSDIRLTSNRIEVFTLIISNGQASLPLAF